MADKKPPGEENRDVLRVAKPIEVSYRVEGTAVPARLEDLSEGGAYLDTPHPLPVGTQLTLELTLPEAVGGKETTLRLAADVVWTNPGLGAGISFRNVAPEDQEKIRFFVASVYFGHA